MRRGEKFLFRVTLFIFLNLHFILNVYGQQDSQVDNHKVSSNTENFWEEDIKQFESVHDHSSSHGGQVGMAGSLHVEFVAREDGEYKIYITGYERKPIDVSKAIGFLIINPESSESEELILSVDKVLRGFLWAKGKPHKQGETITASMEVEIPGQEKIIQSFYLLRNLGRGHGIGFFQAHNFYPDFIMWFVEGKNQQITFIDPHGMRMVQVGFNDPKVRFYQEVKTLERQIGDADVVLDSFIISVTPFNQIGLWDKRLTQKDFEERHILFQDENGIYVQKVLTKMNRGDLTYSGLMAHVEIVPDIELAARFKTHLPLYSLSAACGKFGHGQKVQEDGWVYVGHCDWPREDMFMVRAVGNSMEPRITNGDYCIFRADQGGTCNGKIVLVECMDDVDPDTGKYTIKMYSSKKREENDVIFQEEIVLRPLNKSFGPIILTIREEGKFRVAGVFVDVLRI